MVKNNNGFNKQEYNPTNNTLFKCHTEQWSCNNSQHQREPRVKLFRIFISQKTYIVHIQAAILKKKKKKKKRRHSASDSKQVSMTDFYTYTSQASKGQDKKEKEQW